MNTETYLKDILLKVPESADVPSPKVWESIQRSMKRRDFWRIKGKCLVFTVFLILLGGTFFLFFIQQSKPENEVEGINPFVSSISKLPLSNEVQPIIIQDIAENHVENISTINTIGESFLSEPQMTEMSAEVSESKQGIPSEKLESSISLQCEDVVSSDFENKLELSVNASAKVENVYENSLESNKTENTSNVQVIFPSAFTPNGDGLNDTYKPLVPEKLSQYVMRIYNKSNQLVFHTILTDEAWDGTFRGQIQPRGVYICVVSCVSVSGKYSSKAEFLLLRD